MERAIDSVYAAEYDNLQFHRACLYRDTKNAKTMCRSRVQRGVRADTRFRLRTKLCGETVTRRGRLFKVHNRTGSLSGRASKSDYKNRFILTGARDPTKTRPALNPLSGRIETPHLLATTDAFTATDYRSLAHSLAHGRPFPPRAYATCHVLQHTGESFYYFS